MPGDEDAPLVQWDNKIGMATVVGCVQIVVVIACVVLAFGSVRDAVENSKVAVTELKNVVQTIQTASQQASERITRVEERTDAVAKSLDRIERKVDLLPARTEKR